MTKPFTFPYDTCEIPNKKGMAQPYSVIANIIIISVILYFLFFTKSIHSFLFIFSVLLFELSHTFSHIIHISGGFQFILTHILALITLFTLFNLLYNYTKVLPNILYFFICGIIFCIDLFFLIQKYPFVYNVFAYAILFLIVLFSYFNYLPKYIQRNFYYIFLSILLFSFFEINEILNCDIMLKMFPTFPFHIFIELSGLIPVYFVCKSFYNL